MSRQKSRLKTEPEEDACSATEQSSSTIESSTGPITQQKKKVFWREYVDPNSDKRYYSNGSVTTWKRPQANDGEVVIVPSSPRSRKGPPPGTPPTPVLSNKEEMPPSLPKRSVPAMSKVADGDQHTPANKSQTSKKKSRWFSRFKSSKKATQSNEEKTAEEEPAIKSDTARSDPASPDRTESSSGSDNSRITPPPSTGNNKAVRVSPVVRVNHTALADIIIEPVAAGNGPNKSILKRRKWREYTDPDTGKTYYSDGVTTTWKRPPNFTPEMSSTSASSGTSVPSKKKEESGGWREYIDVNSGKKYYSDGTYTTWKRPIDFAVSDGVQEMEI